MEELLSILSESPWVFLLLLILAIISAVQPTISGSKFIYGFGKIWISSGLTASINWARDVTKRKCFDIIESKYPNAVIASMIFESATLFVPIMLTAFFMVLFSSTANLSAQLWLARASFGIEQGDGPTLFPIFVCLLLIALNTFAWAMHSLFCLVVLHTVGSLRGE